MKIPIKRQNSEVKELLSYKQRLKNLYAFIYAVTELFILNQGMMVASSVAYSFLLALVPFLAFLTIFLGNIQVINIQGIRHFLETNLVLPFLPTHQEAIMRSLDKMIENATTFGWIGFFSFLLVSGFFLNKISNTFNWIYKSPPRRKWLSRLLFFLFGLIIFALSLTLMLSLLAPTLTWLEKQNLLNGIPTASRIVNKIRVVILSFIALFLMIKGIPSAKVQWKSAFAGALCATIAVQATNLIFTKAIATSFRYEKLYGSLAAVVIFLIWVNWISVMLYIALEIAYVHQYQTHLYQIRNDEVQNPFNTFATALTLLQILATNQDEKQSPSLLEINQILQIPEGELWKQLRRLEKLQLVTKQKKGFQIFFQLTEEAKNLSMNRIIEGIFGESRKEEILPSGKKATEKILSAIKKEFEGEKATWLLEDPKNR